MVGERSRTTVGELVEPWLAIKRGACDFSSFMNMDELFSALPFCSLANSTGHASASRALQGFGFRLHCLAATACGGPSNPAYVTPRKIHPWIFRGLQKRFALLHAQSRPPWLVIDWQVRAKNPSMDFLGIAEALRTSACC